MHSVLDTPPGHSACALLVRPLAWAHLYTMSLQIIGSKADDGYRAVTFCQYIICAPLAAPLGTHPLSLLCGCLAVCISILHHSMLVLHVVNYQGSLFIG